MIKFLVVMFFFTSTVFAQEFIFDSSGKLIDSQISDKMKFPDDLDKTNLSLGAKFAGGFDTALQWIGRISNPQASCSAQVVMLPGGRLTDKIKALTAGHCIEKDGDFLLARQIIYNEAIRPGAIKIQFLRPRQIRKATNQNPTTVTELNFSRILFASYDVVDMAILEADITYDQIVGLPAGRPYKPLQLDEQEPVIGSQVNTFGIPASEIYASEYFHNSTCQILGRKNDVPNDPNAYAFLNKFLFNCTVLSGMSGGAVTDQRGYVVGVNTGFSRLSQASVFSPVYEITRCFSSGQIARKSCFDKLVERK